MAASNERSWGGFAALILALLLSAHPLPEWLAPFRPDWVAVTMIYLSIHTPRRLVLTQAFVVGLLLDALHGTPLGQYALALLLCCYLPMKLHLRLMLVPVWQSMMSVALFTAIYQFVLFWCNGATGNAIGAGFYLWPILTNALAWPIVLALTDRLRLGPAPGN